MSKFQYKSIAEQLPPVNETSLYYTGGGNAKVRGSVSGRTYLFREGVALPVDNRDLPELLAMTKPTGCCGKKTIASLFQVA